MSEAGREKLSVVDRNGVNGTLDLEAMPPDGKGSRLVLVRFRERAQAFISSDALVERKEGGYYYRDSFDEAMTAQPNPASAQSSAQMTTNSPAAMNEQLVVPILEEELTVEKRRVERGGVRIVKTVIERTETIDLPLMEEQTEVERVAINRIVETAPPVRYEGDVMIVPLLEEVIVTEKRLMLREELRIRKRQFETHKPQEVIVRREEATIERFRSDDAPPTVIL
ncbi:MAG: YsnF/AvaK domain-containing protein [Acidobacteriota bacterium]|nr:YsnF/AvaK domain-containing protein [Acidobacteriota bacterium]